MKINVWLALRDDAQAAIRERLTWDEESQGPYTGPVPDRVARVFEKMGDRATVQRLFKTPTIANRQWTIWSILFDENKNVMQRVKAELDHLEASYPNRIQIVGAWHYDTGRQVGADYDDSGNRISLPLYPVPGLLSNFMPDDPDGSPNAALRDVNLYYGQAPRDFS